MTESMTDKLTAAESIYNEVIHRLGASCDAIRELSKRCASVETREEALRFEIRRLDAANEKLAGEIKRQNKPPLTKA